MQEQNAPSSRPSRPFDLSASTLQILAMVFMVCDHLWATVVPGNEWLTVVGRLAFPIYAFMIVEGVRHTRSLKKYVLRLLGCALLAEIPFNLMYGGSWIYPFGQNVIWTFMLGIGMIALNEKAKKTGKIRLRIVTAAGTIFLGWLGGTLLMLDYHGEGVLMVLVFYFFSGRRWYDYAGQLAAMVYINFEMISGLVYPIALFGSEISIPKQAFAVLALLPIRLYHGRAGIRHPALKWARYGFYPAHMLVLGLIEVLR